MKRIKSSAMLAISMVLSHHGHGANAEPAAVPLSAAEHAQCKVQVTEVNQGVQAYNAELDAIKALEAEIIALSAVIGQVQATVDRSSTAAMQALNAQIDKNNEMVERHEQMKASIKAMSSLNKQRAEQFRLACENRSIAPPATSKNQLAESPCDSATGTKDSERELEATFTALRADQKQREAEVERISQTRAKAQSWSDAKRRDVWLQLLVSPKFAAFEREKQPLLQELFRVIGSKARNAPEQCRLLRRIAATLPVIKAINARQYTFMANEIRAAK